MLRTAVVLGLALVGGAAGSPAALAHTQLDASVPADGARLHRPPAVVELTFDDPVEDRLSRASIVVAGGRRRPLALTGSPAPNRLVFAVPANTRAGEAVVAYRALSADGHPVAGAIVFASAISARAAARARGAARAAAARDGRPVAAGAARILAGARGLQYLAITIVLGGGVFLVLVWGPASWPPRRPERRSLELEVAARWRRLGVGATMIGAASAAVAFAAQTAVGMGSSALLTLHGADAVIATRAGAAWLLALAVWLTVAVVLRATRRQPDQPRTLVALALPLALLTVVPATSGHAGRDPTLLVANVVHVCAVSTWLGGLVALLVAVRTIGGRSPEPGGRRLLDELVARFSGVALVALAALATSGATQSALLLGGVGDLATTGYGRLLAVKIALTVAVVALGARQRHAVASRPQAVARATLVSAARIEMLVALLALVTTALLAGEAARG